MLERKTSSVLQPGRSAAVGGVQPLVDLINRADPATERVILESLQDKDPELAEAVRAKLFVFADITSLEDRAVQLVLRQVETSDLAVALKGVSSEVREKVMSNVSERASENLLEEISLLGPDARLGRRGGAGEGRPGDPRARGVGPDRAATGGRG